MEERILRAWMLAQEGIRPRYLEKALEFFGSAVTALQADAASWHDSAAVPAEKLPGFLARFKNDGAEDYATRLQRLGVRLILPEDEEYPQLLRQIAARPPLLYAKGTLALTDLVCVAIVGSRRATQYGRRAAEQLAHELGDIGICVVSGLARGIDSAAHSGALASVRGKTCAVVGTGIDIVYPAENKKLAEQIAERGVILSEYPLGAAPLPYHFPERNRIISGISLGVTVVEASAKSGALITADCALEQGREVFAIPGNIYALNSQGTHQLIKQGARLTESVEDILEELGLMREDRSEVAPQEQPSFSLLQEKILTLLEAEPKSFEVLQQESRLPAGTLLGELMQLEINGACASLPGRKYIRV